MTNQSQPSLHLKRDWGFSIMRITSPLRKNVRDESKSATRTHKAVIGHETRVKDWLSDVDVIINWKQPRMNENQLVLDTELSTEFMQDSEWYVSFICNDL